MENYRVNHFSHSEYGDIWFSPTLSADHCYGIFIPFYCKFTVIHWPNDSEDMKLVVATSVVFFNNTTL